MKNQILSLSVRTTGLNPQTDLILGVDLAWEIEDSIHQRSMFIRQPIARDFISYINRKYRVLGLPCIPEEYHDLCEPMEWVRNRLLHLCKDRTILLYNQLILDFLSRPALVPATQRVLLFNRVTAFHNPMTSLLDGMGFQKIPETRAGQQLLLYLLHVSGDLAKCQDIYIQPPVIEKSASTRCVSST